MKHLPAGLFFYKFEFLISFSNGFSVEIKTIRAAPFIKFKSNKPTLKFGEV